MNIFIINGGQTFAHSGGMFNNTLTGWTVEVMKRKNFAYRVTNFDPMMEVENFKWADIVIYHTPIWWFQLPNRFKRYLDEVFTAGHNNGIYRNDGRSRKNLDVNYGTGGLMQGKRYMLTTSWNAPQTAFTLEGEFFDRQTVDEVLFGFHKMNQFVGMKRIEGFHFHDLEKNATEERIDCYHQEYTAHINEVII